MLTLCELGFLLAQSEGSGPLPWTRLGAQLLTTLVFAALGIAVLFFCIWIFDRLTPYSFRKEILQDQNTALGIIVAAVLIGMAIIIAAAIHG